ncbi:MAG: hypothetical protein ACM4D3_11870 [Candidatus Sericytochromatia bacterium]
MSAQTLAAQIEPRRLVEQNQRQGELREHREARRVGVFHVDDAEG